MKVFRLGRELMNSSKRSSYFFGGNDE